MTVVRRLISEQAFAAIEPFHAEELHARVRTLDRGVSLASVYRTLGQLVEADLLRTITGTHGERHYTVVDQPAAGLSHIVCTDCKRVHPMDDPCLPMREGPLVRRQGFVPLSMSLRIEAACEELRLRGTCSKQPPSSG